jgi:hypothetical protein
MRSDYFLKTIGLSLLLITLWKVTHTVFTLIHKIFHKYPCVQKLPLKHEQKKIYVNKNKTTQINTSIYGF